MRRLPTKRQARPGERDIEPSRSAVRLTSHAQPLDPPLPRPLVGLLGPAVDEAGVPEAEIVCDGALKAVPGATQTCTVGDHRSRTGVLFDGDPGYTEEELEQSAYEGYAGVLPDSEGHWSCAGGLDSVEGATQDCTYESGDETAHIRISVAATEDDYPVLEDQPFVTPDEVAAALEPELAADGQPGNVTCNSEPEGVVDNRTECTLRRDDGTVEVVEVRVTRVGPLRVGFEWNVLGESSIPRRARPAGNAEKRESPCWGKQGLST